LDRLRRTLRGATVIPTFSIPVATVFTLPITRLPTARLPITRFSRGAVVASRFLRGALIASSFARFADGALIACYLVKVFMFFEEIGHVEKRVALQTQIHECRLHSGENAGDSSFMNAAGERIFVGALEINFAQLIVFDQRHFGLVPVGRDHQFLAHSGLHLAGFREAIEDLSAY
jgi:hypothetical protein